MIIELSIVLIWWSIIVIKTGRNMRTVFYGEMTLLELFLFRVKNKVLTGLLTAILYLTPLLIVVLKNSQLIN